MVLLGYVKLVQMSINFEEIDPHQLAEWLEKGEARLIDVREPAEHAVQAIPGATLIPLSTFDPAEIVPSFQKVVFHCRSGNRSATAAKAWSAYHNQISYSLKGGILAWDKSKKK